MQLAQVQELPGRLQDRGSVMTSPVPAHVQKVSHSYGVRYPDHDPRAGDPHYKDFNDYRRRTKSTAKCDFGTHRGDYSECSLDKPLELHHAHIEFALQNSVNLTWLEHDYPGVSNPDTIGAWVESADNLIWLCEAHHRGPGGIHNASASDFEAERYISNLISKAVTT